MYYQELYKFGYYHGMVPDIDNEQLAEIILDHGRRESEDVADTTHEDFDFPDNEQLRKVIAHIKKEFNYINPERKLILKNYLRGRRSNPASPTPPLVVEAEGLHLL